MNMKKKVISVILVSAMLCGGMSTVFASSEIKPNPDIGYIREETNNPPECEIKLTEEQEKERKEKEEKLKNWYESLTDEQKEYFERNSSSEYLQRELQATQKFEKERDSMIAYLEKNLKKNCYTYVYGFSRSSSIEIGVPSAKYIPKIDECIVKQNEKAGTSVHATYRLSKHSLEELEKMKSDLNKDADFKKAAGDKFYMEIESGYIKAYFVYGKPKSFDDWLKKNSKYSEIMLVTEWQKPNPD